MLLKKQAGISLIEMLAVVIVLGLAASVVTPNFAATNPARLEVAAEEVAQALRYARNRAISMGSPVGYVYESSSYRMRVFNINTAMSPWAPVYDIYHPVSKKLYDIDVSAIPSAAVSNNSQSVVHIGSCNAMDQLYFDSQGMAWCTNPDTTAVREFKVVLSLDGFSRTVTLNGRSGRVTIS
ncbi:MAG: prepilin-type N-terminal cleavage/methylation domain-containing protein [Gammaproteobacteria bacterium]|nr:prepilin-type N-terminal cleavage/methylation domain-containing protein [Gammaproteobacteria bacterium]